MEQYLPIECDNLCDDYLMENVMDTLQNARLEHLIISGKDIDTAYEMSELELAKRKEAYEAKDYVRSILGVLEQCNKDGEQVYELKLRLPKAFK